MAGKTIVLITGANTGLGFEMVKALARSDKPYEILVAGRTLEKVQKAIQEAKAEIPNSASQLVPLQLDLDDDATIDAASKHVESNYGRLDALVNNAGAQFDQQLKAGAMTMRQVWTRSWAVNTVGTQVLTDALVPLLLKSGDPRLLFMASGTSSLEIQTNFKLPFNTVPSKGLPKDLKPMANVPSYRAVKAGMNMMMREWARFLQEDGVKVWALSPGYLATGLGGSPETNKAQGAQDPSVAGEFVKSVLEGHRDADVGKVILRTGIQPW